MRPFSRKYLIFDICIYLLQFDGQPIGSQIHKSSKIIRSSFSSLFNLSPVNETDCLWNWCSSFLWNYPKQINYMTKIKAENLISGWFRRTFDSAFIWSWVSEVTEIIEDRISRHIIFDIYVRSSIESLWVLFKHWSWYNFKT